MEKSFGLLSKGTILVFAVVMTLLSAGCTAKISNNSSRTVVDGSKTNEEDNLPTLKIGVLPSQTRPEQERMIKPLDEYLEKTLGRRIDFYIAKSYEETVDWMVEEKVDIGYLGPLVYVEAVNRGAKIEPLVAVIDKHTGQPWYRSCILVRADSPIKSLKDLKGKRVAFTSKSSTSGYLMPLAALKKLDINPERDFAQVLYPGNHSKTIATLKDGIVDAAGTNISSYLKQQKSGKIRPENYRVLWESTPITHSPIVVSKKLPPELIQQIKRAFLTAPDNIEDLSGTESAGYTIVSPSDYASIKQLQKELDLSVTAAK